MSCETRRPWHLVLVLGRCLGRCGFLAVLYNAQRWRGGRAVNVGRCQVCGETQSKGARFCSRCGSLLGETLVNDVSKDSSLRFWEEGTEVTWNIAPPEWPESLPTQTGSLRSWIRALGIVTALSPLLMVLDSFTYGDSRVPTSWTIGLLIPSLLVLVVAVGSRMAFGFHPDDSRIKVVGAIAAFFVALRAVSGLRVVSEIDRAAVLLSLLLGLTGFAVAGLLFAQGTALKNGFTKAPKPVHVVLVAVAALQFVVLRQLRNTEFNFVFSAGSIVGPSPTEYLFLAVLIGSAFLVEPLRQVGLLTVAAFSLASYCANAVLWGGPIMPWPNPVIVACCVFAMLPWNDAWSRQKREII